jgi:uncharacterized membrane protein
MIAHNLMNKYRRLTKSVNKINARINHFTGLCWIYPEYKQTINYMRKLRDEKLSKLNELEEIVKQQRFDILDPLNPTNQMKYNNHIQQVRYTQYLKLLEQERINREEAARARKEIENKRLEDARKSRIRCAILNKIKQDINDNFREIQTRIVFQTEKRKAELDNLKFNNMSVCHNNELSYHNVVGIPAVVKDVYHQPVVTPVKRPINFAMIITIVLLSMGYVKTALVWLLINTLAVKMMVQEGIINDDYKYIIADSKKLVLHEEPRVNKAKQGELTMRSKTFYLNY